MLTIQKHCGTVVPNPERPRTRQVTGPSAYIWRHAGRLMRERGVPAAASTSHVAIWCCCDDQGCRPSHALAAGCTTTPTPPHPQRRTTSAAMSWATRPTSSKDPDDLVRGGRRWADPPCTTTPQRVHSLHCIHLRLRLRWRRAVPQRGGPPFPPGWRTQRRERAHAHGECDRRGHSLSHTAASGAPGRHPAHHHRRSRVEPALACAVALLRGRPTNASYVRSLALVRLARAPHGRSSIVHSQALLRAPEVSVALRS